MENSKQDQCRIAQDTERLRPQSKHGRQTVLDMWRQVSEETKWNVNKYSWNYFALTFSIHSNLEALEESTVLTTVPFLSGHHAVFILHTFIHPPITDASLKEPFTPLAWDNPIMKSSSPVSADEARLAFFGWRRKLHRQGGWWYGGGMGGRSGGGESTSSIVGCWMKWGCVNSGGKFEPCNENENQYKSFYEFLAMWRQSPASWLFMLDQLVSTYWTWRRSRRTSKSKRRRMEKELSFMSWKHRS